MKSRLPVVLFTVLVLVAAFCTNPTLKPSISGNGIDVWEYQTMAVNLVEFGRFPVMGYLADESVYQLDRLPHTAIESYFKCRFIEHGPVTYVGKPPLYPLALAATYALYGTNLRNGYFLNLSFLVATVVLIVLIGHNLNRQHGWKTGLASAVVYILFGSHALSDILPANMLSYMCCLIALTAIRADQSRHIGWYAVLGALFGLGLLTKGNIIFVVMLYPLYLLLRLGFGKQWFTYSLTLTLSAVMAVIPWMIPANVIREQSAEEWASWKNRIFQAENICVLDTMSIDDWQHRENRRSVVRNQEHHRVVSHIYSRSADRTVPIVISNQATTDEMLSVHNEYTVDGDWHPEWRFRESSLYNRMYSSDAYLVKIVHFYWDNPVLLFKIAFAKLGRSTSGAFSFFLLAMYSFGIGMCLSVSNRAGRRYLWLLTAISMVVFLFSLHWFPMHHIILATVVFILGMGIFAARFPSVSPPIFVLFLLNCLLTVVVFYGHSRFINVIEPLSILSFFFVSQHTLIADQIDASTQSQV